MTLDKILEQCGLSKHEASIYLSLIENGPSLVAQICKDTGYHRPTVYKHLHILQDRGLLSVVTSGKQKFYTPEDPIKLKNSLDKFKLELEPVLSELQQTYEQRERRPAVKFFIGRKGIQFILTDLVSSLKRDDVYYRYSSHKVAHVLEKYIPPGLREEREQKHLQRFMITDQLTNWQKKPNISRDHRLLPPGSDFFEENLMQLIYKNKVAFIDIESETGIIIENPIIASFQKRTFKILYNLLQKDN